MKVLAVPDRHFPWAHRRACDWVVGVAKTYQPDAIVGLGDELDLYSYSRFPRSHNLYTPLQEYRRGMGAYRRHWQALREAAPKAACFELSSNHGDRLHKRVLERFPEVEHLIGDPYALPEVKRVKGEMVLDRVIYMHGFRSNALAHATYNQQSVVHGHTHKASLLWRKNRKGSFFNLECGWLGDEGSAVFNYKMEALTQWTMACGLITNGAPTLLRFPGK